MILIGYKGDMVEEVVRTLHPDLDIEFVYVERFEGDGSGLGHSLMMAAPFLQKPFIFIPNDAVIGADDIVLDPEVEEIGQDITEKTTLTTTIPRTLELSQFPPLARLPTLPGKEHLTRIFT